MRGERSKEERVSETGPEAARRLTEAFGEPYQEVVRGAVDAQQRNVQLAQGWVESVTGVLESQAEANRALTRAMESPTNAVEAAIKSQARTSRALAESLEAYREVIERNTALQEKSTNLVQGFFGDVTSELREGMQGSQEVARSLMEGSERQMEAFQAMLGEAMNSYANLMNAPFDLYRKNLEAFGKQDQEGGRRSRREAGGSSVPRLGRKARRREGKGPLPLQSAPGRALRGAQGPRNPGER